MIQGSNAEKIQVQGGCPRLLKNGQNLMFFGDLGKSSVSAAVEAVPFLQLLDKQIGNETGNIYSLAYSLKNATWEGMGSNYWRRIKSRERTFILQNFFTDWGEKTSREAVGISMWQD